MYKFGDKPPRALLSFGVSGLLDEPCRVYYENLFSTGSIGRVSDLISARLNGSGMDELRLRAILLFGVFEGYRNPGLDESSAGQVTVECGLDGVKMAVGVSFVNLSLAGKLAAGERAGVFGGLVESIHQHSDRVLVRVLASSGKIEVVSVLAMTGRMKEEENTEHPPVEYLILDEESASATAKAEFIQLADLDYAKLLSADRPLAKLPPSRSGTVVTAASTSDDSVLLVRGRGEMNPEAVVAIPAAAGESVDHARVLGQAKETQDRKTVRAGPIELTEAVRVGGAPAASTQEELLVRNASAVSPDQNTVVGGIRSPLFSEEKLVVGGGNPTQGPRKITVAHGSTLASEAPEPNEESVRLPGDGGQERSAANILSIPASSAAGDASEQDGITLLKDPVTQESISRIAAKLGVSPQLVARVQQQFSAANGEYQQKIHALEEQIRGLKAEKISLASQAQVVQSRGESAKPGWSIPKFLRSALPFFRGAEQNTPAPTPENSAAEVQSTSSASSPISAGPPGATGEVLAPPATQALEAPKSTETAPVEELKTEPLERAINRLEVESGEIRNELTSERAKARVDGLMGELLAEKAQFMETAKKMNISVRQKEFEFRNRQQALLEDLRRREEALRQKDSQIMRLKEQVSEMTMALERSRSSGVTGEASRFKQRAEVTQKMLATAKSENTALKAKVEDLRSQLNGALQATKSGSVASAELNSLRMRYDLLNRQFEEFRRANHQLSEKLALAKRDKASTGGNVDDLRRRLEMAMQTAAGHQKETEELRLRMDEQKREEVRLKMELGKATTEAKNLKVMLAKYQKLVGASGGGGSGGSKAA